MCLRLWCAPEACCSLWPDDVVCAAFLAVGVFVACCEEGFVSADANLDVGVVPYASGERSVRVSVLLVCYEDEEGVGIALLERVVFADIEPVEVGQRVDDDDFRRTLGTETLA